MSPSEALDFFLFFPFPFDGSSPNSTFALAGRLRTADAQFVGAGCFPGGTLLIQMRHIPAGGAKPEGTTASRRDCSVCAFPDLAGTGRRCASATPAERTSPITAGAKKRQSEGDDLPKD